MLNVTKDEKGHISVSMEGTTLEFFAELGLLASRILTETGKDVPWDLSEAMLDLTIGHAKTIAKRRLAGEEEDEPWEEVN